MDGQRRYTDEPGHPSWYPGQNTPSASPYDSGVYERPSGAFRLPDQRFGDDYAPDPVISTGSHARPAGEPPRVPASATPPPAAHTYDGGASARTEPRTRGRDAVYAARRSASAVAIVAVTALLTVPALRLLYQVTFVDDPAARGIVPAVLLSLGLPLTGVGLYALAAGGRRQTRDGWLRLPLAYLPVGLLVIVAAALAVA